MGITVEQQDAQTFQVTVEGEGTTVHTVRVPPEYALKLTLGRVPPQTLVEKSFEFLLERESNSSILRSFELSVIGRYFPEYEREIANRLQADAGK